MIRSIEIQSQERFVLVEYLNNFRYKDYIKLFKDININDNGIGIRTIRRYRLQR